jgi:hypothetical protein
MERRGYLLWRQQMGGLLRLSTNRKGLCAESINSRRDEKNLLRASTNGLEIGEEV